MWYPDQNTFLKRLLALHEGENILFFVQVGCFYTWVFTVGRRRFLHSITDFDLKKYNLNQKL